MKGVFQHRSAEPERRKTFTLTSEHAVSRSEGCAAEQPSRHLWTPPDAFRILSALANNALWLLIAPVLALALTVLYIQISNPTYEIGAQVMVRFGQELAAPPTVSTQTRQAVIPISKRTEDTMAEVQIMKDPELVRLVVEDLGVDFFYAEPEPVTRLQKIKQAVSHAVRNIKEGIRGFMVRIGVLPKLSRKDRVILFLQSALSIEHVARSDVIELKLNYPDPELGEEVLRRFLRQYFAKREKIYRDDMIPSFFAGELQPIEQALKAAEEEYRATQEKLRAWSVEDQRSLRVRRHEAVAQELEDTLSAIKTAKVRLREIEEALALAPEFVPSLSTRHANPMRDQLELKLIDLELQLDSDKRRFGEKSQQVLGLERKIEELKGRLAREPEIVQKESVTKRNPLRESLQKEKLDTELLISGSETHAANLRAELAALEGKLDALDSAGLQLGRQLRDVERLRRKYERYRSGLDEARIASAISEAKISNVVVIAQPDGGVAPVKPRVFRLFVVAILFSLAAASGLILLIDALRPKIRSNRDIVDEVDKQTIVRAIAEKGRR